ncbi:hypothetical protein N9891_00525 [bacterium]|nr:hypothetical protein [bacterium]
MKKLLILTATLLTGGLALPASAQTYRNSSPATSVFISGYLQCGTPIYSKRVRQGNVYHSQRLSHYELQRYHQRQREISRQRESQRRFANDRGRRGNSGRQNRGR